MIYLVAGFIGLLAFIFIVAIRQGRGIKRAVAERKSRNEAMFASMFPELQPHYHPENLLKFVKQRRGRTPRAGASAWDSVDGFPDLRVEVANEAGSEVYRLLDGAGALATTFRYDTHAEGGVMRVGKGKLTVRTVDASNQRVSYWHPNREFKWSRRKGWMFVTPMADDSFSSSRHDRQSFSSSSSDSSRSSGPSPFAGAGGSFDGGGASGGWDDAKPAESPSSSTSY